MVIRVLAGVVPMITGALIFSGVIPVGQWIMGSAAPNPTDMIRTMSAIQQISDARSEVADGPTEMRQLSPQQQATMTDSQRAAYRAEQDRLRQAALRARMARSSGDADGAGWAPAGGGWGR